MLPTRVRDYSPALLDELLAGGEFLWSGTAEAPGNDGWIFRAPTHDGWDERAASVAGELAQIAALAAAGAPADWRTHFRRDTTAR